MLNASDQVFGLLELVSFICGECATLQNVPQRVAKVDIQNQIDDGIQRRVEVAEPDKKVHDKVGYVAGLAQERAYYVDDKERQPAGHEAAHDDRQCFGDARLRAAYLMTVVMHEILEYVALFRMLRLHRVLTRQIGVHQLLVRLQLNKRQMPLVEKLYFFRVRLGLFDNR